MEEILESGLDIVNCVTGLDDYIPIFQKTLVSVAYLNKENNNGHLIMVFSLAVPIMTEAAMTASLCYGAPSHEAPKL